MMFGGPTDEISSARIVGSVADVGINFIDTADAYNGGKSPLEEPLRAMDNLIRQGKVRYYGLSNFVGWRIAEVCRIADTLGMDRPVVSQPLYNIVDRRAEAEQLPAAGHYGLGTVPTGRSRAAC